MNKHPIPRVLLCAALALGAATLRAQSPAPSPGGSPGADGPSPHGHHGPPPSRLFRTLDANADGMISADEIANAPTVLKTLADASGQITREALRPPHREGDEARGPRDDSTHPHRPRPDAQKEDTDAKADGTPNDPARPPHHGPPHGDRLFDALDTNHDGVISAEEIAAATIALKKADTNGDGVIDRRDFRPPSPAPAN